MYQIDAIQNALNNVKNIMNIGIQYKKVFFIYCYQNTQENSHS